MKNLLKDTIIDIGDECLFKDVLLVAKKGEKASCNGCYFYKPFGESKCFELASECFMGGGEYGEYIIFVKQ